MKIIAVLLALFAVASAEVKPRAWSLPQVRGGAEIGPLDGELALQLSKAAATAYVAGSASKYIAGQTGTSSTQVRLC